MTTASLPPCPHGNHRAATHAHDELVQVCKVCGGPRIAASAPTSGRESEALRQAHRALIRRRGWRVGAGFGAAIAAMSASFGALIALIFGGLGVVSSAFLLLAAPFSLLFVVGLAKGSRFAREATLKLAEAWKRAARDVVQNVRRAVTGAELAQLLGAKEEDVERWLAELSVEGAVRSDVTDDGQIAYVAAQPLRIEAGAGAASDVESEPNLEEAELEARFAELARHEAAKPPR